MTAHFRRYRIVAPDPAEHRIFLGVAPISLGVKSFPKLVVTLLGGFLLTRNVTRFGDYAMDIDVCPVAYQRQYFGWDPKTHISGDLETIQHR